MALFHRKSDEPAPERRAPTRDERPAVGVSATLNNSGPQYGGRPDELDTDHVAGTSSGMGSSRRGLHGKPKRGSREDPRW